MKVNWIEIENIKSFKDATRITLNNDNNFVVGTNGSGKTTLLQVLSTALMILVPQYRAEMQANGPVKKVKLTQSPYNVNLPKNFKRPADDQRVVIELSLEDSSSGLIDEIKQYKDIFTQNSDYITENFWEQEDILTETNRVLTVLQSHTNFVFKFFSCY